MPLPLLLSDCRRHGSDILRFGGEVRCLYLLVGGFAEGVRLCVVSMGTDLV